MAKNIWSLDIPTISPFKTTDANAQYEDLSYNGVSTGRRYYVSDPSYIHYYEK